MVCCVNIYYWVHIWWHLSVLRVDVIGEERVKGKKIKEKKKRKMGRNRNGKTHPQQPIRKTNEYFTLSGVPPSNFFHSNCILCQDVLAVFMGCSCSWCCYHCWEHTLARESATQLVHCWAFYKHIYESYIVSQKLQQHTEIRNREKEGVILTSVVITSLGTLP